MVDRLLTEIQRQKKYLDRLPGNFTFPLFNAKTALESQRRNGYRNTSSAAREIVDNALEAGADAVHVVFETARTKEKGSKQIVKGVAFIDNGSGMIRDMARYALSWGGGTHFEDPHFIGRFGFGLPNASINQTRRVEVFTRTSAKEPITKAWLDADDYPEHGMQEIPEPVDGELPEFVRTYIEQNNLSFDHGTVVYWKSPDRLTFKTPAHLKEHLLDDFGTTYRYLLERFTIIVEGKSVERVDPMFLDPKARFYVAPDKGGAQLVAERSIPVALFKDEVIGTLHLKKINTTDELQELKKNTSNTVYAAGVVHVRVARFPLGLVVGRTGEAKIKPLDEHSKKRFQIRVTRRGMSFVRADREIETVMEFPRNPDLGEWPLLQGYAYHWAVETKFDPALDEAFGITNDKQRVRPIEDFWRLLKDEEVNELLNHEQNWQAKQRNAAANASRAPVVSEEPTPAEISAGVVESIVGTNDPVPDHEKPTVQRKFEEAVKERRKLSGEAVRKIEEALIAEAKRRPYLVDYFEDPTAPFYVPEWGPGLQVLVHINRKHPFYETFYLAPMSSRARSGLDLFLIALAKGELKADNATTKQWYEEQRTRVWSEFLRVAMTNLSTQFPASDEDEEGAAAA